MGFQATPRKYIKLPADLTLSGSEINGVGQATEKDLDPIFVLNLGVIAGIGPVMPGATW